MDDDEIFNKWKEWMENISEDITGLLMHHMFFQEYPRKKGTGNYYKYFTWGYVNASAMGVRRHIDTDKDVLSFKKLLKEISTTPQVLSRERVNKLHQGAGNQWFDRYVGTGLSCVNSIEVNKEISVLQDKSDSIRKYANKTIAHLAKQNVPTMFNELDECLNYLKELWEKYYSLLCGIVPTLIPVE